MIIYRSVGRRAIHHDSSATSQNNSYDKNHYQNAEASYIIVSVDMNPFSAPRMDMPMFHYLLLPLWIFLSHPMMLVPTTGPSATAAGMTFVRSRPLAPEADALIVTGILTARKAPLSLEFTLPASAKAFAPIGVLVAPEALVTDANRAIALIVIRHFHFWASPECGRVMDCSPRPSNPVYKRLYRSRVPSTHLFLLSIFLVAMHMHLISCRHRANQSPTHESAGLEPETHASSHYHIPDNNPNLSLTIHVYHLQ